MTDVAARAQVLGPTPVPDSAEPTVPLQHVEMLVLGSGQPLDHVNSGPARIVLWRAEGPSSDGRGRVGRGGADDGLTIGR